VNREIMTLSRLASFQAIDELVGSRPARRWGRASLIARRSDGHSIASWFEAYRPEERITVVRESILDGKPWQSLMRVRIPKRPGSTETRAIDMPTVLDQARLYVFNDWLSVHAETVLTRVASAFRRGVRMSDVILNAHRRTKRLPFAAVVDISAFYDNIRWHLLDAIIAGLPADEGVRVLLRDLVRVDVLDRRTRALVVRTAGIPQGLSCSPVLANLLLNEFDQGVAHALSRLEAVIRRWCDDILLLAATGDALQRALGIVQDRLAKLGFTIKPGTGRIADLRAEPIAWLGISFGPCGLEVPFTTIGKKVIELQAKLDQGILDPEGVEDRLMALHRHYRWIIHPGNVQELITSIREKLVITNPSPSRKENLETIQRLIDDRHHRGPFPSWERTRGQPDGVDDRREAQTDQGDRRAVDPERYP